VPSDTGKRLAPDDGGDYGHYRPGAPGDACVSQWLRTARAPAALRLSLEAAAHLEPERKALDQRWPQRLARAAYEAERAARP
jgi:hypothetical protein